MPEYGLPLITVLMPVFNGEEHLRAAIESVLNQSFTSFELLVVNDGSTDNTDFILAEYAKSDGRVVVLDQSNAGIVAALNIGLDKAKGKYVARMDADDISHPERLRLQFDFMEANPNCVALGSDYKLIGARSGYVRVPHNNEECRARLLFESCFAHPTVMLRTSSLNSNSLRYEQNFQFAEDYRLWTVLSRYGNFASLNFPLLQYRVHHGQTSRNKQVLQRNRHSEAAVDYLNEKSYSITKEKFEAVMWPDSIVKFVSIDFLCSSTRFICFVNKYNRWVSFCFFSTILKRAIKATLS